MKLLYIPLLTFIVSLPFVSCEKAQFMDDQPDVTNKIDTISLFATDAYVSFDKYVVLYDQDDYLIKTPFYAFMEDLWKLTGAPSYDEYLEVSSIIIDDANQNDELIMSDYFDTHRQQYLKGFPVKPHYLNSEKIYIINYNFY
jgi:hypothetical protein